MIELTEEPYDGAAGVALIAGLHAEVNVRYAHDLVGLTDQELAEGDAAYLAEVTAADVLRPFGAFVVAWRDGVAVACGALKRFVPYDDSPSPDGVGEVKRMFTVPEARRLGLSRRILARLEAIAAELGYQRLLLETGLPQYEAIELYRSAGWVPVTPYGHYRHSPENRSFAKDLTTS